MNQLTGIIQGETNRLRQEETYGEREAESETNIEREKDRYRTNTELETEQVVVERNRFDKQTSERQTVYELYNPYQYQR